MNTTEEWRPVFGYEGLYEVSDIGNVKSLCARYGVRLVPKVLSPVRSGYGYASYQLTKNAVKKRHLAHAMVLSAFVGPRPAGLVCCHADGNHSNNHVGNLRWATQKENMQDAKRHGTTEASIRALRKAGEGHWNARLTTEDVLRIREASLFGASQNSLSRSYGVKQSQIWRVIKGLSWSHIHS